MAAISVTNTFVNSTPADATEVNQNFSDLVDGLGDGTKDITVSAVTANGAATFNGAVTLGNATGDDIVITGRVDSHFDPKTASTYDLGDATQLWRAFYGNDVFLDRGAVGTPSGSYHLDADTGSWSPGANIYAISTGGTEAARWGTDQACTLAGALNVVGAVTFNEAGADVDFRVEGDTDGNLFFVDASTDRASVGIATPDSKFVVSESGTEGVSLNSTNRRIHFVGNDTSGGYSIQANDTSESIGSNSSGDRPLHLQPAGGNVGVGVAAGTVPGYRFETKAAEASDFVANFENTSTTAPGGVRIQCAGGGTDSALRVSGSSAAGLIVQNNGVIQGNSGSWGSSATQDVGFSATGGAGEFQKFTSSRRYKDMIMEVPADSTGWIYDTRPVTFRFKNDQPEALASNSVGYVAEEISKIAPKEFVFWDEGHKDGPREESLHYKLFVVPIIQEMKKLRERIRQLES